MQDDATLAAFAAAHGLPGWQALGPMEPAARVALVAVVVRAIAARKLLDERQADLIADRVAAIFG